jgi:protein TonB
VQAPQSPQQQQQQQTFRRDMKVAPKKTIKKTVSLPLPPEPQAELPITTPLPPRPVEQTKEKPHFPRRASHASAPNPAARRANHVAAPAPGASAHDPNAVPSWKSRLLARLERFKRYPAAARTHGDEGVAQLAFSVDRAGRVHHARILRSSGSRLLDRATLALVERAQPLPPPPPEMRGAQIAIVVPIHYSIR